METPNELLRQLRKISGKSQRVFGELVGWGEHIQKHLETGAKRFTKVELQWLLDAPIFSSEEEKGRWKRRFELALEGQPVVAEDRETLVIDLRGRTQTLPSRIVILVGVLMLLLAGAWWFHSHYVWVSEDDPVWAYIIRGRGGGGGVPWWLELIAYPETFFDTRVGDFFRKHFNGFWYKREYIEPVRRELLNETPHSFAPLPGNHPFLFPALLSPSTEG